ncbi:hypothetical protein L1987_03057 [Smallanthus sonchifolius]|uniref:Uncharacterized protein n=1 Tax=Smallanthus sonchifolius TaxID=185202 RepID=A0ACB9K9I4_9ASTR|nr:hypothetical protein L1987_03057 [Smallanthus sonchifolius]
MALLYQIYKFYLPRICERILWCLLKKLWDSISYFCCRSLRNCLLNGSIPGYIGQISGAHMRLAKYQLLQMILCLDQKDGARLLKDGKKW